MPNDKGWYSKEEALSMGLPIWIKQHSLKPGHWTHEPYKHAVLLTKSRCKELKMPVGNETPSAFRYKNSEASSYRYIPLYDRTSVFQHGELPYSILREGEVMGRNE